MDPLPPEPQGTCALAGLPPPSPAHLCDEGSARMVLDNKKLFQAGPNWVTLCSSKTNMLAYKIWPHRVRIIITSNRWQRDLSQLDSEDADWLRDNSVYLRVDTPLWLVEAEPPPGQSEPPSFLDDTAPEDSVPSELYDFLEHHP